MTFKWTPEAKADVAAMLKQGKTAQAIGDAMGMSRNCIVSVVHRDKSLAAIGFVNRGGRPMMMSREEYRQRRRMQARVWRSTAKAKKLAEQQGNVVQFPKRVIRDLIPQIYSTPPKPRLSVVSNNVPLMVQDWLEKNGGARKFGERETTESWIIRSYLAERGFTVGFVRGSDKWNLTRPGGRTKVVKWADIMRLTDEIRIAEGLPPFSASAPVKRRQEAVG